VTRGCGNLKLRPCPGLAKLTHIHASVALTPSGSPRQIGLLAISLSGHPFTRWNWRIAYLRHCPAKTRRAEVGDVAKSKVSRRHDGTLQPPDSITGSSGIAKPRGKCFGRGRSNGYLDSFSLNDFRRANVWFAPYGASAQGALEGSWSSRAKRVTNPAERGAGGRDAARHSGRGRQRRCQKASKLELSSVWPISLCCQDRGGRGRPGELGPRRLRLQVRRDEFRCTKRKRGAGYSRRHP